MVDIVATCWVNGSGLEGSKQCFWGSDHVFCVCVCSGAGWGVMVREVIAFFVVRSGLLHLQTDLSSCFGFLLRCSIFCPPNLAKKTGSTTYELAL